MKIASQKRKENVAEYILFMWQLTDLLRSLKLDEQQISRLLVAPLKMPLKEAEEELAWYMDICNLIRQENKETDGFLSITEFLIGDLYEFHIRLSNEPADDSYKLMVFNATPAIVAFKAKVATELPNDIFYAFYALYSKLLMKMKGTEISQQTNESFDEIARMVAYLSKRYKQFEEGTFSFSED